MTWHVGLNELRVFVYNPLQKKTKSLRRVINISIPCQKKNQFLSLTLPAPPVVNHWSKRPQRLLKQFLVSPFRVCMHFYYVEAFHRTLLLTLDCFLLLIIYILFVSVLLLCTWNYMWMDAMKTFIQVSAGFQIVK